MDAAGRAGAAKQRDHPLDLPPVAETDEIAERPAVVGADRRLVLGEGAEAGDKIGRVGKNGAAVNMDMVGQGNRIRRRGDRLPYSTSLANCRTQIVNDGFTILPPLRAASGNQQAKLPWSAA